MTGGRYKSVRKSLFTGHQVVCLCLWIGVVSNVRPPLLSVICFINSFYISKIHRYYRYPLLFRFFLLLLTITFPIVKQNFTSFFCVPISEFFLSVVVLIYFFCPKSVSFLVHIRNKFSRPHRHVFLVVLYFSSTYRSRFCKWKNTYSTIQQLPKTFRLTVVDYINLTRWDQWHNPLYISYVF